MLRYIRFKNHLRGKCYVTFPAKAIYIQKSRDVRMKNHFYSEITWIQVQKSFARRDSREARMKNHFRSEITWFSLQKSFSTFIHRRNKVASRFSTSKPLNFAPIALTDTDFIEKNAPLPLCIIKKYYFCPCLKRQFLVIN